MTRKCFFSFHYEPDNWRAAQVRNIGYIEGNSPASDNDWETVKRGGDAAIERWIDSQFVGKSCTILLIGQNTANRKWINYELIKSWSDKKGIVGIHIHNLKDSSGKSSSKGADPLDSLVFKDGKKLSSYYKSYDPPYTNSQDVYKYISDNLENWIEIAYAVR